MSQHFPMVVLNASAVVLALLSSAAWAADEAQWRVTNTVTPSVVPLYHNLPSPFPTKQVAAPAAIGPTPEELLRQQELALSIQRTKSIINGENALQPDFSNVRVGGVLKGPLGWSVLVNGRWVREGSRMQLPSKPANQTLQALSDLSSIDPDTAAMLSMDLSKRMETSSTVSIQSVASQSVILQSAHGRWQVPISQVGN